MPKTGSGQSVGFVGEPIDLAGVIRGALVCFALVAFSVISFQAKAAGPEIWFAPPDNVVKRAADFEHLFKDPGSWSVALQGVKVWSVPANYLQRAPAASVGRLLSFLQSRGIKLDVSILGLAVDKKQCGHGVEGMIWPGEEQLYAKVLKERGAIVDSFSFDTPLNSGHLFRGRNACRFSVRETAQRLAASVRALRAVYPNAKMIDQDVPTGMPVEKWRPLLEEWLEDFKEATGEPFYGFTMDVYWGFRWQKNVAASLEILKRHGVRSGIFINADGRPGLSPPDWVAAAKRNFCDLRRARLVPDYKIVANWSLKDLKNLPETSPVTLTSFLGWVEKPQSCN